MSIIDSLLDVLAPHICVGCGTESSVMCFSCVDNLGVLPSVCYACGKATSANKPCAYCVSSLRPKHVWMATAYDKIAKKAVWALKLEQKRSAAAVLAGCISDALPYFAEAPLITYVPTAPGHRRSRGFDHAQLLAKELARMRGWNYATALQRSGEIHQRGASREQRIRQLKGVFRAVNSPLFMGKHILLVDDVVTTGSTLNECTKILIKAGAAQVDAVVFARTPNV